MMQVKRYKSKALTNILWYCIYKKSWPNLYIKLLYELNQDFLDILYEMKKEKKNELQTLNVGWIISLGASAPLDK